jgi:hypothetical protein
MQEIFNLRRRLKLNKKFQSIVCDEGDEIYPNGIFEFNITKIIAYIQNDNDKFPLKEVVVKSIRNDFVNHLNETTIKNANILTPIILAEISPGLFNVIDGHHRLERAYRDGVIKILAYKLLAEQHIMFMTSTKAYKKYIEYWNNKIKGIMKCNQKISFIKK